MAGRISEIAFRGRRAGPRRRHPCQVRRCPGARGDRGAGSALCARQVQSRPRRPTRQDRQRDPAGARRGDRRLRKRPRDARTGARCGSTSTSIRAPFPGVLGLRLGLGRRLRHRRHGARQSREDRRAEGRFQRPGALSRATSLSARRSRSPSMRSRTRSSKARSTPSTRWSTSTAARCACRARLANDDRMLRPGLFARITVEGRASRTSSWCRKAPSFRAEPISFVFRVDNGKAVEIKVRLGERKAGFVEVLEGLEAGRRRGHGRQQRLRDGARVEVVSSAPRVQGLTPMGCPNSASAGRSSRPS